jgi:hypothetical protein
MLLHHSSGTLTDFGGKTVGFIALHDSIFSEFGASSFPGAVHRRTGIKAREDQLKQKKNEEVNSPF